MQQMTDLESLLRHDIQMLCSVEDQIIEALPAMIAKVQTLALKQALNQHLDISRKQRERLDMIRNVLGGDNSVKNYSGPLPEPLTSTTKCVGIEGLIQEGQKIMAADLSPDVMDAALTGACQKIEHYEMACYGTARTFARQLGMTEVAKLLQLTLEEEADADKLLSVIAENNINIKAASPIH